MQEALALVDGSCDLCMRLSAFVAPRARSVRVAASQDEPKAVAAANVSHLLPNSVVLLAGARVFVRSPAIVRLLLRLRWPWPLAGIALWLVPLPIRDAVYRWSAKRRHNLCRIDD